MSSPATSNPPLVTHSDEVLVRVEGVSKKFCRSLKKSLWYGVCDIAGELSPFGRRPRVAGSGLRVAGNGTDGETSELVTRHSSLVTPEARDEDLRDGEFYAVRDVSFELRRGECLGLIGHNGAGKTTLLKMLNGLIKPDAGTITMRGRVGALIALGAGFNPILTGRENIYINGSVLGLSKKEIDAKIDEIIDFAEIGEFIDSPVQNYSSGMQVRLGFAVATALDPDILILDEVLAVGDARFQAKCLKRITQMFSRCCVIFVSHQAHIVQMICSRVLWMRKGETVEEGAPTEVLQAYLASSDGDSAKEVSGAVLAPEITRFDLDIQQPRLGLGETLHCCIHTSLSRPLAWGRLLVCLLDASGRYVARATCDLGKEEPLSGDVSIHVSLKDLRLAIGEYKIQILCFSSSPVVQLANYTHSAPIYAESNIVSEVKYQPASTYELKRGY
jgi:ABC-type polysaccharide/polyol phosphate transport system ATPase subunit